MEIKDCPFCGGEGHLNWVPLTKNNTIPENDEKTDHDGYYIECEECEVRTRTFCSKNSEEDCIKFWNTRSCQCQS